MYGGVYRIKAHIAGIRGNVASCIKASKEDRELCNNAINEAKLKKKQKSDEDKEMRSGVNINNDGREDTIDVDQLQESFGSMKSARSLGPMDKFASQISPEMSLNSEKSKLRNQNISDLDSFKMMLEAVGQFGPGLMPPTRYEASDTFLKKEVDRTKSLLKSHEEKWKLKGCSIMTDGCEVIFEYVDQCIEEVGPDNVVQIVTDNAANNMGAAKLLKEKRPTIFWTSCGAHTIDLMLESIAKQERFKKVIDQAKSITIFLYAHHQVLAMMRAFTKKKDIVRPGVTRFASAFLTLQSLNDSRTELKAMFGSPEWELCKYSKSKKGKDVYGIVMSLGFWSGVGLCLQVFTPLIKVLRIADGDTKRSMGFLYGELIQAKEDIKISLSNLPKNYEPIIEVIDGLMKGRLDTSLHLTAYLLNPFYHYNNSFIQLDKDVVLGMMDCIDVMYPGDISVQDKILNEEFPIYREKKLIFGKPLATGSWFPFGEREREREREGGRGREMADAAVEFLLNNLKDLLLYHSKLITETKSQIESLEKDLRIFKAFLKDSVKKRRKDEQTKVLVQNIRDVVYEVEDVLDAFVTQLIEKKSKNYFLKFWKSPVDLHTIGKQVEDVKKKVEQARIDYANHKVSDEHESQKPEVRPPREKDVVGFEDVMEELIRRLTEETNDFDVVSLIGMFGLGKTTLAWKLFNDPAILYEFPIRIWLSISQEFSDKDIFLGILKEFTSITEEIRQKDDRELARTVASHLQTASFLIVMDDVWTPADWDRLRIALPKDNTKGKVLITSRNVDVGKYASCPRPPHELRFFTQKESWELLRLEALRKPDCPSELEGVGQRIARDCQGLPLAIVVIGGILATKFSASDISSMRKEWDKVSKRVSAYLLDDKENDLAARMKNFISLSYDKLPYHLRACFLYLGMFPEDYEIPASKLIRIWIGEGFIQQDIEHSSSLEETAEKYLADLINRNLVRIDKFKPDGKVKTCRIHDTLRDFCRAEAGNDNENFLQEIKFNNGVFAPPVSELHKYRRLSIHSNCLDFISSKPIGPRVRSFVCLSKDEFTLPPENIPDILAAFKLLRVLDIKPITFPKINSDIFQLVHVRYIALSLNLPTLPSKFSQLWNIQTLIVDTTSRTLEVKADIWNMKQLRHFKTNASATLPKPSKDSKHGAELQTLGTISVESCTAERFDRASNLKKLGIRGQLALLLEGKMGSFDSLGKMKYLEKLKLINDVHPRPASEGILRGLPEPYKFPPKLRSLTLVATFLSWNVMSSILGLLENLEVLKLKDKAFMGDTWKTVGAFQRLEFLHIEHTDLAVWEASPHHFPALKGLVLRNCEKLLGIPAGLAEVASLRMLDLHVCAFAAASASEIHEAKIKTQPAFKLSIFPPIK
ncbi:hypothetical protein C2S53_001204 [Perilla frutescens var. hirtella]|uniref:Uncharacterized protein n=1 Tax=Perilla frutescens var. hirtella TaxID=608512 RepID=A0AAD4JS61_PERFH|nr:hypothetical protein C2S53_001204 [Perilla frutescens var. hirtella]